MNALLKKDIYALLHTGRSLLLVMLLLAAIQIPGGGMEIYILTCAVLCGMLVVSTMAMDEHARWPRMAMVTPIRRETVVAGKYVLLLGLGLLGVGWGLAVGWVVGCFTGWVTPASGRLGNLLRFSALALALVLVMGGSVIPLVFRYGAERGRLLMIVSMLLPVGVVFGLWQLLRALGVTVTDKTVEALLPFSPLAALVWDSAMYALSCRIFRSKALN